jgi:hypothetical protein
MNSPARTPANAIHAAKLAAKLAKALAKAAALTDSVNLQLGAKAAAKAAKAAKLAADYSTIAGSPEAQERAIADAFAHARNVTYYAQGAENWAKNYAPEAFATFAAIAAPTR